MIATFLLLALITNYAQGEIVCHEPFGCFSDEAPFHHYLMSNPKHPRDVGTSFTVHTEFRKRSFRDVSNRSVAVAARILQSKYLKVIIHGALESSDKTWVRDMTKGLLKKENSDVIVMDYGDGATGLNAAGNARLVGAQLAYLLKNVFKRNGTLSKDVHVIGFSLGAHVAGFAGTRLIGYGYKLGRITGLDAGDLPYGTRIFENAHPFVRLDKKDADFVDLIHTDIKGLGIDKPIGHLDFYPNGGVSQPGCGGFSMLSALGKIRSREGFFRTVGCHHLRAVDYFIESLRSSCKFTAYPCVSFKALKEGRCENKCFGGDCPVMGYDAINYKGRFPQLTGKKLYLETNGKAPFCKNDTKVAKTSFFQDWIERLASYSPW